MSLYIKKQVVSKLLSEQNLFFGYSILMILHLISLIIISSLVSYSPASLEGQRTAFAVPGFELHTCQVASWQIKQNEWWFQLTVEPFPLSSTKLGLSSLTTPLIFTCRNVILFRSSLAKFRKLDKFKGYWEGMKGGQGRRGKDSWLTTRITAQSLFQGKQDQK